MTSGCLSHDANPPASDRDCGPYDTRRGPGGLVTGSAFGQLSYGCDAVATF
jgi:hypothetical protein